MKPFSFVEETLHQEKDLEYLKILKSVFNIFCTFYLIVEFKKYIFQQNYIIWNY